MRLLIELAHWLLNNGLSLIAILISVVSIRMSVRNRRHDIAIEGFKLKAEVLATLFDAQYQLREAKTECYEVLIYFRSVAIAN